MQTNSKQVTALLISLLLTLSAQAQSVPPLINYQGRLTDQTGAAFAAGSYGIQFRLWDSPTATATNDLIWAQQQAITIQSNGVFNAILGSPGGIPIPGVTPAVNDLTFAFSATSRYLGVMVVSQNGSPITTASEILPRQQILSVPFALQAQQAQQAQLAQTAQQAQVASTLVKDLANALCPAGSILPFGGDSIPSGWLLCDGTVVSRSAYTNLFATIGTAWGSGDGSTTFNLPDLRGVFLRGVSRGSANDPDKNSRFAQGPGGNAGNTVGSFQTDEFKSHTHSGISFGGGGNGWVSAGPSLNYSSTGASGGNETRPKNAYVNFIVKY